MINIETAIRLGREHKLSKWDNWTGWSLVMLFRQLYSKLTVVDSSWGNWKDTSNDYWGKPNFLKESTYDRCIYWSFDFEHLQFKITFLDGNLYDGFPARNSTERTWTFQITQHDEEIWNKYLIPFVENRIQLKAESMYASQLEEARERAINLIYQNLVE